MEKNTVKANKLIACDSISITAVATFRNKVFVAGYGDKLFVYYLSTGRVVQDPLGCRRWPGVD